MKRIISAIIGLGLTVSSSATIINIPADYPTIQQGIDASSDGDTVLVQPGDYGEVNIIGRVVTVGSRFLTTGDESYIQSTRINGTQGSAVRIAYCTSGDPVLVGFKITGGSIGIQCLDSNPVIAHNYIDNIHDDLIYGDAYSVGIKCEYSNASLYSNIINDVFSFSAFGTAKAYGIHCLYSDMILHNNIITGTRAVSVESQMGSGFCCEYSYPILFNNIIAGNGPGGGGGIRSLYSNPLLLNDIIWYNSSQGQISGTVTANYCNVSNYVPGEGNINEEPRFIDWESGNFHLKSVACGDQFDSPCIDTGSPAIIDSLLDCGWGLGTVLSDMGAYGGGDWSMVDIDDNIGRRPGQLLILRNYPNPFNASTILEFALPEESSVELVVYNLLGQKAATVVKGVKPAGNHSITWDGSHYPSGVYFARLQAGGESKSVKMLLLK
jgi:hypothetical protein